MKYLLILMLLFASPAYAQTVYWANGSTFQISWNPVTLDTDGEVISKNFIMYYVLLLAPYLARNNVQIVTLTTQTTTTVVLPSRGLYYVGVRSFCVSSNLDSSEYSEINWADLPANQEGSQLFGLRWGTPAPK